MSDLNGRVCELLGWTEIRKSKLYPGKYVGNPPTISERGRIPDYPHDLNACFRDLVPEMGDDFVLKLIGDEWTAAACFDERIWGYAAKAKAPTPAECICRAFVAMKEG